MDKVEKIIMLCANDDQCPISDVISEISSELEVEISIAAEKFISKSDFIIANSKIIIEMSDEFWVGLKPVQKSTFFASVDLEHLAKRGASPFFYISIAD